jgi:hypothetical protein
MLKIKFTRHHLVFAKGENSLAIHWLIVAPIVGGIVLGFLSNRT